MLQYQQRVYNMINDEDNIPTINFNQSQINRLDNITRNIKSLTCIPLHASSIINDNMLSELIKNRQFFTKRIEYCKSTNQSLLIDLSLCTITEVGTEKLIRFIEPFSRSCRIKLNLQDNNIQLTKNLLELLAQIDNTQLQINIHGNPITTS